MGQVIVAGVVLYEIPRVGQKSDAKLTVIAAVIHSDDIIVGIHSQQYPPLGIAIERTCVTLDQNIRASVINKMPEASLYWQVLFLMML